MPVLGNLGSAQLVDGPQVGARGPRSALSSKHHAPVTINKPAGGSASPKGTSEGVRPTIDADGGIWETKWHWAEARPHTSAIEYFPRGRSLAVAALKGPIRGPSRDRPEAFALVQKLAG